MSTDRLERRLPEVLTELSLPSVPDYVDTLLSRTERMSQRPSWTFLERWFPVSTITAALPVRRPSSLRPLIAVAILIALVIASIAWYAGSHPSRAPLLGLARNGVVVTTGESGIVSVDPVTGAQRTLVAGPGLCCINVTRDGQRMSFFRGTANGAQPTGLVVANVDGTVVHEFPADVARGVQGFEWSPGGDRILITKASDVLVADVATGQTSKVDAPRNVLSASWIGTTGDILMTSPVAGTQANGSTMRVDRLAAGTTSGATQVATLQYAVHNPVVSPDGSKFLYFIWGPEIRLEGKLHVFDFATGLDRAITPEVDVPPGDITEWENAVWSTDGSLIASELYTARDNRIAVIPASGGTPVLVGPAFPTGANGAAIRFSPDGTTLLVTYRFDGSTWLLPVSGAEGRQVSWVPNEDIDWQRLAP
jgi:hypothetical protein